MSEELPPIPKSWCWVKLPQTGEMNRGKSRHRPRNEPSLFGGPYPFIQTGDIANSGGRIRTHRQTYSETGLAQSRLWPAGTICITIAANIAESALLTYPTCIPDSVVGIIANPKVSIPEYVEYFIRVAKSDLAAFAPATAQANINVGILNDLHVPLPPLAEQRRIVAKLETLLGKVDASQERLAKIPVLLKRFRQSVLAAACSGRLTADWREENPESPEWETVGLVELAERIQIGPFGTQLHKADYVSNGIPLINPTHIQSSRIVHDPDFTVSKTKLRELENYVLQTNDIIMGRRGEMARCALVSQNENGWLCGTGSLFVRPKSSVSPAFLFLVLRSPETKAFLEGESKGSTMSNLNLEILKSVPVSISSLPEQQEIVRRVEGLFALADQLEVRLAKARGQVDQLTPSLLARAFAGKLVPQNPADEPASKLLECIESKSVSRA